MRHRPIRNPERAFRTLIERTECGERLTADDLIERGFRAEHLPWFEAQLDAYVRDQVFAEAAEMLRKFAFSLGAKGTALRRVICGDCGETQTQAAKAAGMAKQNLARAEERIKKRLRTKIG